MTHSTQFIGTSVALCCGTMVPLRFPFCIPTSRTTTVQFDYAILYFNDLLLYVVLGTKNPVMLSYVYSVCCSGAGLVLSSSYFVCVWLCT